MLADVSEQGNFHNNTEPQLGITKTRCEMYVARVANRIHTKPVLNAFRFIALSQS